MKSTAKADAKRKTARVKLPCSGRRILVVDDEKTIRDLFLQIISYGLPNCRVDVAVNGEEAVEAFRQARHCILVMDLKMPVMEGEEAFFAIQKLCEEENWCMPSIIFCSGYTPSAKILRIVNDNPADCLLKKPVLPEQLMAEIKARLPA